MLIPINGLLGAGVPTFFLCSESFFFFKEASVLIQGEWGFFRGYNVEQRFAERGVFLDDLSMLCS